MKKRSLAATSAVLLFGLLGPTPGSDAACIDLKGEARTNSLGTMMTLGSAQLQGNRGLKLRCGVHGVLQGFNAEDGSLHFQHTIACDDHSVFILDSHTQIKVENDCQAQGMAGSIASFEETSAMVGVDGPYADWTGTAWMSGRIDCGWNHMKITGRICSP